MLMTKFQKFLKSDFSIDSGYSEEDLFYIFYQDNECGKSFVEMLAHLAYQIYELQVCMEGLIEDQEITNVS